jgi:hypothetical protein
MEELEHTSENVFLSHWKIMQENMKEIFNDI